MKKFIWPIAGLATVAILIYAISGGTQSDADYIRNIEKQRSEKDHQFKTDPTSPVAGDSSFKGLNYFPVDPKYRVRARLIPSTQNRMVTLPTSDGKEKRYREYGYAEFELLGKKNRLLILEIMDMGPYRGTLFLAFGDETSASETYGAGRYLDVKKEKGASTILLDFNLAYNPYCAYSDNYSCPLPPSENLLSIPVRAGEKNYK